MKEYKREKALYESQVQDLSKRSQHHDDHLRIVDAWFTQVNTPRLPPLPMPRR
jgi:E3 ubiquitin-protein ligase BRE1